MQAKRFIVKGLVQGVFFRKNTQAKAQELGLSGGVRNLSNGDVEAWAQGKPEALSQFEKWLWQGSEQSKVESVQSSASAKEQWEGFRILPNN